jgi:NlpC/P60 family
MQKPLHYQLGGRDYSASDCWGYIYLYYQSLEITIPTFLDYHQQHPTPDSLSLRSILKRVKSSGFHRVDLISQHSVLLGYRSDGFAFGVYNDGRVQRMTDSGYLEQGWEDFKGQFDRVLIFDYAPNKVFNSTAKV